MFNSDRPTGFGHSRQDSTQEPLAPGQFARLQARLAEGTLPDPALADGTQQAAHAAMLMWSMWRPRVRVRVTGQYLSLKSRYSFAEVDDDGSGAGWVVSPGGITDGGKFTLCEVNGRTDVHADPATGVVAWAWLSEGDPAGLGGGTAWQFSAPSPSTDFTGDTLALDNTTFNFVTSKSASNYLGVDDVVFTLAAYDLWVVNGPGYYQINAPVEVCGWLFACCTTYTFAGSSKDNWAPPAGGGPAFKGQVVVDLTAHAGGTSVSGIQPQPFGAPVNTDAVTGATNATPIVLTVPGWTTQPAVGQALTVTGVLGNTAANGTWTVQASTATTATLRNSAGNGAFLASPGSAVQAAGPQVLALVNAGADAVTLNDAAGGVAASSDPANRVQLPPAYGATLVLEQKDSVVLWWDACTDYQWKVLASTAQPGVTGEHNGAAETPPYHRFNFVDSASVTFAVSDDSLNKSVDVTATVGGGATSVSSESYLNADYTVTSAFADSGLSVAIPSAGTYLIEADVAGALTVTGAAGGYISARLWDVTNGLVLQQSVQVVCEAQVVSQAAHGSTHVSRLYTAAGAVTVRLEAQYTSTGAVSSAKLLSYVAGTANGGCLLRYVKLA